MSGRRVALIIANDEYEHEGLRQLISPAADARALAGVLGDPHVGGFTVQVARNQSAHIIGSQIEDLFSEGRPDDVLLLHFSCHGLKSESGQLFFAAANTRPNRLGSTAVSADFVQECMRASRSRSIVLLLDCCYGGAFSQGVSVRASGDANVLDSFPGERVGGGRGRAVITASSSMEYAFEGSRLAGEPSGRPSVFTAALVEGLATGEADRDEDGWVSLNELYDYVFDKVREQTPHQTPSRNVDMQGELYLARSRRRRIRALPIPPDLRTAMTDTNMFARVGAVTELRSRLLSDNLPMATGAHEALTEIAGTDIQYVAEAAAAALREATIQTSEQELRFPPAEKGSSPAPRTVRLLGPPLARACTFQTSHSWIHVVQSADGDLDVSVSVDTSLNGELHGEITIKAPTGEAVILVDVEVTPGPPTGPEQTPPPLIPKPGDVSEPKPGLGRQTPSPSGLPAQSPDLPAPAPRTTVSTPPRPPTPDGWRAGRGLIFVAAVLTGILSTAFGISVLATFATDSTAADTILYIQLIFYGVLRVLQSRAAGEADSGRRRLQLIVGLLAPLMFVLAVLPPHVYLGPVFWLLAGPIEVVTAFKSNAQPARRLEIVHGVLGSSVGLLVVALFIALGDAGVGPVFVVLGIWLIVLGTILVVVGFKQRQATHQ